MKPSICPGIASGAEGHLEGLVEALAPHVAVRGVWREERVRHRRLEPARERFL